MILGLPLDPEVRLDPELYNFYSHVAGAQNLTLEEWVAKILEDACKDYGEQPVIVTKPSEVEPFKDDRHPCKWWTGEYVAGDQMVKCGLPSNGGRPCNWAGSVAKQCPQFSPKLSWLGRI